VAGCIEKYPVILKGDVNMRAYLDHGIYTGCIVTHKCAEQSKYTGSIWRHTPDLKSLPSHKKRFTLYTDAHAYGYRCAYVPSLYMLGGYFSVVDRYCVYVTGVDIHIDVYIISSA
jgi:hypothetical protein